MSLKPSIGQIVNPFFLQDGQDANPSAYTPPYLKTGGASWSGTGLVYDVTALEYYFNGDKLTAATQVTLDASDPTYNRLDAIVVDEAGVVSVIKGDASASPISPSVDESHILIQYILVEAGSTQPTIAKEDIYLENVEWTTSTYTTGTATGSIDFDNAVSPKQGVKCISANADARLGARFVRATSFDPYQYTMLSMWVRFTGSNVDTNKSLNVRFENGAGTLVANTINLFNFGLQRNLLNVWQLVVIPITSFGTLPTSVKGLKIIMTGGTVGQARQWDIDLISLTDNSVPSINEQAFNVLKDGALVGQSSTINFKGAPVTVTNDPINKKIDVEVIGGGGTPTQVRYFDNAGVDYSDPLFTRDSVTNHTEATRDYNSTSSTINTATVPVQFLTQNTNGTFNIGDQVETQFGEAQAEVLDVGTTTTTEPQYTNLAYSGVGLNDLTSIYVGGYSGSYPVSYTVEVLQNNVAYASIGGVSGTLSIGDTITGLSSGATAVIVAIDTFKNILAVDTIVGTFIPSEIVQGNTPSDFVSIGGDFSTLADIVLISNTNANSIITTIAPTSQLEGVETSFSSFTGHTIGDTRTFDISPTTISTIVYLTNITGTLPIGSNTRLNNLTTPFQTDDGNILAAQFTIGDTVNVIDLSSGFNQVGQIEITQASGQDFNYTVNSGTIAIGNYLYRPSVGKVGFVYNLTSNIVNKTINTGFRTEPIQFPNAPFIIEGSAIVATDGVDKMAVGVFDSVSGQSELSAGIVARYGDSSQSTFTLQNNDLFIEVYDGASDSYLQSASPTTFTLKNTISGIEHGISQSSGAVTLGNLSGGNNTKITIDDVAQTINFNGEYSFPFADGTSGQALVTDGAGTLSWASAGGGGSPAGSNNQIQINQSSAFFADSTFQKSDTDFNVGLDHTVQSAVTFTGSGLDDLTVGGLFTGTVPTTYTVTVASTGTPDTFDWTDGTNSGTGVSMSTSPTLLSNGISITFGADNGHTLTESWTWDYTSVNQNVLDFSNNDYKFQSVLGTDTFGYQIGDNLLGFGLKGSVNTWVSGSDLGIQGLYEANGFTILANSLVISGIEYGNITRENGQVDIGNLSGGNNTKITIDDVNEHITISNLPAYDDDTAAGVGGLTAGMVYMTTGSGAAPLDAAGILMIKQ